jgi:hypothetical protein
MKRIIIAGSVLLFATTASFAQTDFASVNNNGGTVHYVSKSNRKEIRMARREEALKEPTWSTAEQFDRDFPDASNVHWSRKEFEKATFTENGKKLSAFYDFDSQLIGTVSDVNMNDLPAIAQNHIRRYYPGFTPQAAILFDDNEFNESDMILYERQFNDADNYFIEMAKGNKKIVLKVGMNGDVSYFTRMKEK